MPFTSIMRRLTRILQVHSLLYAVCFISTCLLFSLLHRHSGDLSRIKMAIKDSHTAACSAQCPTQFTIDHSAPNFQIVNTSQSTLYAVSTLNGDDNVRIIVIKKRDVLVKGLYCILWYPVDKFKNHWRAWTVAASLRDLNDHQHLEYTAAFITCPLHEILSKEQDAMGNISHDNLGGPRTVSLVEDFNGHHHLTTELNPTSDFSIADKMPCVPVKPMTSEKDFKAFAFAAFREPPAKLTDDTDSRADFTVCVPVLGREFSNAAQLMQKIEMSRLLGAGRIVFYNHSITAQVDAVLRMYAKEWTGGKDTLEVVVHPWRIPSFLSTNRLYNFGQMAAINDCLYRYRLRSKFTVFTDVDQHIIPRQHTTWQQFTHHIRHISPGFAGLSFRTIIYREERPSPGLGAHAMPNLYGSAILRFSQREACMSPANVRTSMIVDPRTVEEMGLHSAWRLTGFVYDVRPAEGLVHQYSAALRGGMSRDDEWNNCSSPVADSDVVKTLGRQLAIRLKWAWSKFSELKRHKELHEGSLRKSSKNSRPVKDTFQPVAGLGSPVFVYSALWLGNSVRLLAIKRQKIVITDVYCVFLQGSTRTVEKAVIKNFFQFKAPFTSASITCRIKHSFVDTTLPLLVGLAQVKDRNSTPKQMFLVGGRENFRSQNKITARRAVEFTVCVPAMFNFGDAAQLVEKIEMSRLLGAGRIVFYNHSITADVNAVLKMYTKEWAEGKETLEVAVHPWRLPEISSKTVSIPYYAQLASIDHCLHRYRWDSRYTEFSDMDEFLVPLRHTNRSQLLAERETVRPDTAGFMFRCTVVRNDVWLPAKGLEREAHKYGSAILGHTRRDNYVFHKRARSKLIVKPKLVEEMGVHFLVTAHGKTDVVPPHSGLLYHYRSPIKKCVNQTVDTRVADRYGKALTKRLHDVWAKLPGVDFSWKRAKTRDPSDCKK